MPYKDITGEKYGRLKVIRRVENDRFQNAQWECLCDCGNIVVATGHSLRSGHTKSCGCLQKEKAADTMKETMTTHGLTNHPLYRIWSGMIKRCVNPKCKAYKNYGKRGVSVCEEWMNSFKTFYDDVIDGYKPGLELDRINNDANYCKENCHWVSTQRNCRNKRNNHMVETPWGEMCIADLADTLNEPYMKIYKQIKRGWTIDKIISKCNKQSLKEDSCASSN